MGASGKWGRPVHCRVFSSLLGLHPAKMAVALPSCQCDNHKCLQTVPNIPGAGWGAGKGSKINLQFGWAVDSCVTLDKLLNLSEPVSYSARWG